MLLCPQSSGRWSRRRAARAERRDRTRRSPAEMTSTFMTTRSALGQVSTQRRERESRVRERQIESERAVGVRVCGGDKEGGEQLEKETEEGRVRGRKNDRETETGRRNNARGVNEREVSWQNR